MLIPVALLLLVSEVGRIQCSTVPENTTDMVTLLHFKHSVNDPRGALISWNRSTPYCSWEGVKCSSTNLGRVASLNLAGQGLAGQITPFLGNLTSLQILNLSSNAFFGSLTHLNYPHDLAILDISKNSLQGEIPVALSNLSNLKSMDLSRNKLEGQIPLKIGLLYSLIALDLSRNRISGAIPRTFGNATHLKALVLTTNQLDGSIPEELGTLLNLTYLLLGENMLSGGIPPAIFNLSSLQVLDLHLSNLGGALSSNMGGTLPSLQELLLGGNKFEGPIPPSLGSASNLQKVDLSSNNFSGQIPTSFGNLSGLSVLNLDNNMLEARDSVSWEFLNSLRNCSFLQVLSVGNNLLEGAIPNFVGDLTAAEQIYFNGNNLSGIVPSSIGKLTGLFLLDLSNNNLTGAIEGWIGKLKKLQGLYLQDNNFLGPIPTSIANLTNLVSVNLAKNGFEGLVPPSLGSLSLLELNLSYNNLQGSIPREVFSGSTTLTRCILSYNNLEGSIPLEVGKLAQLVELHLSSNKFTGEIPDSLGRCQDLQTVKMDNNFLVGNIPSSFGNLTSLKTLNLSHNNLSSTIPVTLNDLKFLTKLDLSYNHLRGEVPRNGVFENPTAVSLEGNWGLCGGAMDLHMPPCPVSQGTREIQYRLIKILIPIFGFMSLAMLIYFMFIVKKMPRTAFSLLPSFVKQFYKASYNDLAKATKDFSQSNLIGKGSYSSVYRGKLKELKGEVAVKVFDLEISGVERSFMSECEALRGVQHRNILPIMTACSTTDNNGSPFKALIYEFMPKGNLEMWLHHSTDGKSPEYLGLTQRISIAVNISDALAYLHHDCGNSIIIHCDVKPSNILLDDDMNARLGDFGIARLYNNSRLSSTGPIHSIGLKGTIGYIAPGTYILLLFILLV